MFERVGLERTRCAFCGTYELVVVLEQREPRSYMEPDQGPAVKICRSCINAVTKWVPRLKILNAPAAPPAPPAKPAKPAKRKGKKATKRDHGTAAEPKPVEYELAED